MVFSWPLFYFKTLGIDRQSNFASLWHEDRHSINSQCKYCGITAAENCINRCMYSVIFVRIMTSLNTSFHACLPKEYLLSFWRIFWQKPFFWENESRSKLNVVSDMQNKHVMEHGTVLYWSKWNMLDNTDFPRYFLLYFSCKCAYLVPHTHTFFF